MRGEGVLVDICVGVCGISWWVSDCMFPAMTTLFSTRCDHVFPPPQLVVITKAGYITKG